MSDLGPVWSPDGRQIAFARHRGGLPGTTRIYVMNAGDTNQRWLGKAEEDSPAWSPDVRKTFGIDCPIDAKCGTVVVPSDRGNPASPQIPIMYAFYERRNPSLPSLGTIVADPGGPGISATANGDLFSSLFDPLLDRRDLLLIDDRGTGQSGAIDCTALQHGKAPFAASVPQCAAQLGSAFGDYNSVNVADDVDAVRAALGIDKIDFVGISYGTVVGQEYALRHGDHLRSLVLDSVDAAGSLDPISKAGDTGNAIVRAVSLTCRRSATCTGLGGDALARLGRLAARLREQPLVGQAFGFDGKLRTVRVDEARLVNALVTGGVLALNEVDGAGIALGHGDPRPLLRLAQEYYLPSSTTVDEQADATQFSLGDRVAVVCNDATLPWDRSAPLDARQSQWDAALAALPPDAVAPFSIAAVASAPSLFYPDCLYWPAPSAQQPLVPAGASFPSVPTLILNGDLDLTTPSAGARIAAAQFQAATFVELAGVGHSTVSNSLCAWTLMVRFLRDLSTGDTSCATRTQPLLGVFGYTLFPRLAREEQPRARPIPGTTATLADRRVATVAVDTVLDALLDALLNGESRRHGLRGGTAESYIQVGQMTTKLHGYRFVDDIAVSGKVYLLRAGFARVNPGYLEATLRLSGRGTAGGSLQLKSNKAATLINVSGRIGSHKVALIVQSRK